MRHALIVLSCLLAPGIAMGQNSPPVVDAGADQSIFTNTYTLLQGTATDPDGQPISGWLWEIDSAPPGSSPFVTQGG